ncbi:MAG TPA: MBL fold metallo-hydrolase [Chitinophagaceae bacterium]|nr:MBL fold metallo-hydrolase [Chitinophagaceae bacterium]
MTEIRSFEGNPFAENTYLVINEKKDCLIIDPGCYFDTERQELIGYIRDHGLKPLRLINTHCHLDHIFGNRLVCAEYGLKPEIHRLDQPILDGSVQAGLMYNVPFEPSPPPGRYLEEGEKILLGNDELEVLLTAGHSPGSITLFHKREKWLISGDVLFRQSIGRTDLPLGDLDTLLRSIREKLFPLGDEVRVYPGHGPGTTIGEEKKDNPFLQ